MHRHETESQGNFEGFLDNYQSIPDVVIAQQSVRISFLKIAHITSLFSIQAFPPDSTYKML